MGYALIMFGVLLIMSVVLISAVNYGIAKDSQVAPRKAENIYAEREEGKEQTGLTILSTCIEPATGNDRYVSAQGNENPSGPYSFNLTVKNNGSTVLNLSKTTVLYNKSYITFSATPKNVWAPMKNATLLISGIMINTPGKIPDNQDIYPWYELRLLVAAENGVVTIPPTSPTNFTGYVDQTGDNFTFYWNASYDADGIAFYRLYVFEDNSGNLGTGNCPPTPYYMANNISANATSYVFRYATQNSRAYLTAVDKLGNEGIPSRNIECDTSNNYQCKNK